MIKVKHTVHYWNVETITGLAVFCEYMHLVAGSVVDRVTKSIFWPYIASIISTYVSAQENGLAALLSLLLLEEKHFFKPITVVFGSTKHRITVVVPLQNRL